MEGARGKLMVSAILSILIFVLPLGFAEQAADLEKYLDCQGGKKADIVFVFDTTSSMSGEINELSAIAGSFAADLEASRINHRLGLMEFRDFSQACHDGGTMCGSPGDFAYRAKGDGNLTEDIKTFNSWLNELQAGGGGSGGPEAILAALRHAGSDMQWRNDADKILILITDAGPHPDGDCCNAEGDTLDGTIYGLANQGVRVHIIGPDNASLKNIAEDTGGQFFKIRSGLSLKPLLKEITGALQCNFRVETEAVCVNRTLQTKVRLIGKEVIPYMMGQTESWMYLNQVGNKSRYNLSFDQATEAYISDVPGLCGPVELTVYGRVGERSTVQTVQADCGSCGAAAVTAQGTLSISGRVFNDSNGSGVRGVDEAGLEGWSVFLLMPGGRSVAQESDRNGYYIFTELIPGSYKVVANAQENWTATTPETGAKDVELVDVHESEIDFGFKSPFANQTPPVTGVSAKSWIKTIPGYVAHSVHYTNDGGYVITATDGLIKIDADGNKLWVKHYYFNRTLYDPEFFDGQQNNDGGCILTGRAQPYREDNIAIDTDVLLLKTDEGGNQLWNKTFGSDNMDEGHSVQQTLDGGYIITGDKGPDLWLIKTDADGNLLWDKTYGGDYRDEGNSVQQTIDGGYIITGTFDGNTRAVGSGDVPAHLWLIKTDADGNLLWNKTYGSDGMIVSDGQSVQQILDEGYIITGSKGKDLWLIKADSSGNILWDKTFGGSDSTVGACVQQTRDEGYIITGRKGFFENLGDLLLIKTDVDGNLLWDKTFGDKTFGWSDVDAGKSVQQTIDGGYIITGWSGQIDHSVILIKTDENGNVNEG